MTGAKYNGFTNYETWAVNLWLQNEESSYNEFRELAEKFEPDQMYELGQAIKKKVEDATEDIIAYAEDHAQPYPGIIADIFRANLKTVDWEEIAQAFREE